MSIATEITRLQGAKADLKTSIEAKGVTVPSATLISGYASLVDQISGGGGLPDSDGLVGMSIATGDMTESAATLTLTYIPTYLLRYAPSSAISNTSGFTISSKSIHYPSIVWSCSKSEVTISGYTATIPGGSDEDVVFTATWIGYEGETHTTSKTIHIMNLGVSMISVTSVTTSSTSKYIVTTEWPGNIGASSYETYHTNADYYICTGKTNYSLTWGGSFYVLSGNGTTGASFDSVAAAKAAIDML